MKFCDLHCDTIQKVLEEGCDFAADERLHIDLQSLISADVLLQVFACFIWRSDEPGKAYSTCNRYLDGIDMLIEKYGDRLVEVRDKSELDQVIKIGGKTGVIKAIEGATPLEGKPELLSHFYDRGVRLLTIAWDDNDFCGTVFGNQGGLTRLGEELIDYCNDLGVVVDVSHASDKAFFQIADVTSRPFIASHSSARAVCSNERNLTDEMIRIIADRGGIIGLALGSGFICPVYYQHEMKNRVRVLNGFRDGSLTVEDAQRISEEALCSLPPATLSQLTSHIRHIVKIGGEDCLALGSDFDGVTSLVEGVEGGRFLPRLVEAMEADGIPGRIIEKICYQNGTVFFQKILQ